jgi:ATP-dependent Lhr-like helicase
MAAFLDVARRHADNALLALEGEGIVLRGHFTNDPARDLEWCDRALLARIHRYTVTRLRAEIEAVTPADFMRFLFKWQHVDPSDRLANADGLREALMLLDGCELPAAAWESAVLPMRVDGYDSAMLDMLCLSGEIGWARLSRPADPAQLASSTPIALFLRDHAPMWQALRPVDPAIGDRLSPASRAVLQVLRDRGPSFLSGIKAACALDDDAVRGAIGTLVASGLAASDGFAGLRALLWTTQGRPVAIDRRASFAGRWSEVRVAAAPPDAAVEAQAWALLRRYGVMFRRLAARESDVAPWRELARVYRRLEARGEIRGGRFVAGMSGEQFALPGAVERLREVRRTPGDGRVIAISAADPLNLAGIVTAGERVRASARTRLAYRDGVPVAVREGEVVRPLTEIEPSWSSAVSQALRRTGRRRAAVGV